MPDHWDNILQEIQSKQPVTVTDVQFKFRNDGMWIIFRLSDGQEHRACLNYYNVLHMGIDMYRLDQFMKAGTEMYFKPMQESVELLPFTCTCGKQLSLKKQSTDSTLSGTFCHGCDKSYWIRWSDGIIREGTIGDE